MRRASIRAPEKQAAAMYASLGRGVVELLALALRRGRPFGHVTLPDLANQFPGGAVIATAHTGNWDLLACAVARHRPLTVVTKHLSVRFLDRIWQGIRAENGLALVAEGTAFRCAMAALSRGELVAMLVDQVPERSRGTTSGSFLGGMVAIDLAPALVALRARVPIVVAFPYRDDGGNHAVQIRAVFQPPRVVSRDWAENVMRKITEELDAFVRARPAQWLWMHRRWRPPRQRSSLARLPDCRPRGIGAG